MQPETVLDYWFGTPGSPGHGQARDLWFVKSDATDAQIRARFLPAIEAALAGGFEDWRATPRGTLALVLVLDQFTRNVFRGTPRSFAGDARALALSQSLVAAGDDRRLAPLERWFAYMPFEHAESLAMQDEAVRLFRSLAEDAGLAEPLDWALKHHAVIARFGRFPHRNEVLGRPSTAEERHFLTQRGSRF